MYNFRNQAKSVIKKHNSFGNNVRKLTGPLKSKSATKIIEKRPKCNPVQFVNIIKIIYLRGIMNTYLVWR
ncbi:MAG: hypothetical protein MJ252_06015 [archaeon]|nr:hypothetical protein [archaeon]